MTLTLAIQADAPPVFHNDPKSRRFEVTLALRAAPAASGKKDRKKKKAQSAAAAAAAPAAPDAPAPWRADVALLSDGTVCCQNF